MLLIATRTKFNFTLCLILSSADNLCKQFGQDQDQQNVGPDLDTNCLTL